MQRGKALSALMIGFIATSVMTPTVTPLARAVPAPEVEYTYNVTVRRHFEFPNNDGIGYGYQICDKVRAGAGYPRIMGDVKNDVVPNDEFSANYLVSYAVGILCPAQISQLRNSAADYKAPPE